MQRSRSKRTDPEFDIRGRATPADRWKPQCGFAIFREGLWRYSSGVRQQGHAEEVSQFPVEVGQTFAGAGIADGRAKPHWLICCSMRQQKLSRARRIS